jgi:hypothetical protein
VSTDIDSVPRGPGLFEIARESAGRAITNIRELAGRESRPGRVLVNAAAILLGLLAAGLLGVSLAAQYEYILRAKHDQVTASAVEALALDAGMIIFSLLALGLARAGQSARIERALIVVCAFGSAGMNYAAADVTSPRSVAAYVMPPVFLAIVTDRVIAVVRRHVLGMEAERSAWAVLGRAALAVLGAAAQVLLYGLRLVLAPGSTLGGLRRCVLLATPLPAAAAPAAALLPAGDAGTRIERCPAVEPGWDLSCGKPLPCPDHPPPLAREPGESKKSHLARLYRRHPAYGDRGQAARTACQLAAPAGLSPGTARAYIYQFLDAAGAGREGAAS